MPLGNSIRCPAVKYEKLRLVTTEAAYSVHPVGEEWDWCIVETCPREYREIALAWWRQKKLLDGSTDNPQDARRLSREVDRLGRNVEMLGVVVRDYTGRPYGNLNVEAVAIEPDPAVETETIHETISPEIQYKGEVIQKSRVVVHKPGSAPAPAPAHAEVTCLDENASAQLPHMDNPEPDKATAEQNGTADNVSEDRDFAAQKSERPLLLYLLAGVSVALCAACLLLLIYLKPALLFRFDQIDSSIQKIEDSSAVQNDAAVVNGSNDEQKSDAEEVELTLIEYEVKPGDTLYEICDAQGIDYGQYAQLICRLNGLSSPDSIIAGETLVLPIN